MCKDFLAGHTCRNEEGVDLEPCKECGEMIAKSSGSLHKLSILPILSMFSSICMLSGGFPTESFLACARAFCCGTSP